MAGTDQGQDTVSSPSASSMSPTKKPVGGAPSESSQLTQYGNECDTVLDSMETCVACVEGVDIQHQFEEGQRLLAQEQRRIAEEHGLSEAEAAIIRLQMIGAGSLAVDTNLDVMNLCGNSDQVEDRACVSVVSPTDTTLHTAEPAGDKLDDLTERSLVDVADDASVEKTPSTDAAGVCGICSDENCSIEPGSPKRATFCYLPCCDSNGEDNNFNVCVACMLVLTIATDDGTSRIGRCPRCRTWIALTTFHSPNVAVSIRKLSVAAECGACQQVGTMVEQDPPVCDACFLGKRVPLAYECEDCHGSQTIEHTLYRCQPSSDAFGNEMWACNKCEKSTHWRLLADNLTSIPAGDVPEEWDDAFLELARLKVQKARTGIAKLDLLGRDPTGQVEQGCFIL